MMLATIPESAAFWASIATLWGAAAAWFTYSETVKKSHQDREAAVRTVLSGLQRELEVVNDWVCEGYDIRQLTLAERLQWSNPSRLIFSFNCPLIHGLTTSAYIRELEPIVPNIVKLSRSITRLFDYYKEYRWYANSRPGLYDSVLPKIGSSTPQDFAADELQFLALLLDFNTKIHQGFIGGKDLGDHLCLYKAFHAARESVSSLERNLKCDSPPWWFRIVHTVAGAAVIGGLILILRWTRVV